MGSDPGGKVDRMGDFSRASLEKLTERETFPSNSTLEYEEVADPRRRLINNNMSTPFVILVMREVSENDSQ